MRPGSGLAAVAVVLGGLSGCSASGPPSITLRTAHHSVTAAASRWCGGDGSCVSYHPAVPVLAASGRTDITIDVGSTVGKRPWIVLVEGGSASGLQRGRTLKLVAVRPGVTVEVVTVDTDGTRVLQRDWWVVKVGP